MGNLISIVHSSLHNESNICESLKGLRSMFGGNVEYGVLRNHISLQLNGSAEPVTIDREENMFVITASNGQKIAITIPDGNFVPKLVQC